LLIAVVKVVRVFAVPLPPLELLISLPVVVPQPQQAAL